MTCVVRRGRLRRARRLHHLLALLALVGACRSPEPPAGEPGFEGTVVGRTPRIDVPPTPARLVLAEREWTPAPGADAPASARLVVELRPETRVLEALPDGRYRAVESSEAWVGRTVRVWLDSAAGPARAVVLMPARAR